MNAVFHINASEFDENLFNQLQSFLKTKKYATITIEINDEQNEDALQKETNEQYFARINESIEDIRNGKGSTFTMKELEDFIKK